MDHFPFEGTCQVPRKWEGTRLDQSAQVARLVAQVFGADLAEAAAEATEYVWSKDDDGSKDPFAESIPEQTLGHRLVTRIQRLGVTLASWGAGFLTGPGKKVWAFLQVNKTSLTCLVCWKPKDLFVLL